jgi:hypothetical protein
MERLGKALKIVEPKSKVRAGLMAQWNDRLDQDDGAIDDIETYFKTHYLTVSMTKAEELWEHLVYLKNNKDRMRYVTLRATGMPCGSGVTESAAKTVIGERANCSGQRWGESGLRAALTVRAVLLSNRFPAFWRHLARRYTARVELAA